MIAGGIKQEKDNKMSIFRRYRIPFAFIGVLSFSWINSISLANGATFDTSFSDTPCEVITAQMVATTFDIPEKNLEQSKPMPSACSYEMEENGKILSVYLIVNVFEDKKTAAESFHDSTRSLSAQEMTEKLKAAGVEFDESDIKFARDMGLPDPRPTGLQFEDVDGIADQARFLTDEGSLYLLQDNLQIILNAFYGPDMPIPNVTTFEALEKADSAWKKSTMDERKDQAVALAETALAAL